jgi:hypothetical protein
MPRRRERRAWTRATATVAPAHTIRQRPHRHAPFRTRFRRVISGTRTTDPTRYPARPRFQLPGPVPGFDARSTPAHPPVSVTRARPRFSTPALPGPTRGLVALAALVALTALVALVALVELAAPPMLGVHVDAGGPTRRRALDARGTQAPGRLVALTPVTPRPRQPRQTAGPALWIVMTRRRERRAWTRGHRDVAPAHTTRQRQPRRARSHPEKMSSYVLGTRTSDPTRDRGPSPVSVTRARPRFFLVEDVRLGRPRVRGTHLTRRSRRRQ